MRTVNASRRKIKQTKSWGRIGWVVAILIVTLSAAVYRAQLFAAQQLPAYLSSRLSAALGRPVTVGSVSLWPIGAFTVHNVRVAAGEDERVEPMVADKARIYLSWWDLIIHQRLRLRALHVDRATVRGDLSIDKAASTQTDAAATLKALSDLGLRTVGVHDSSVQLTAFQPSGEPQPVSMKRVDLVAHLKGENFKLAGRADQWSGGGFEASKLSIQGSGDKNGFKINRSGATFHGGRLDAQGTYVARGGSAALQVQIKDMPIQTLAPELGIPEEWAVNGNVSGVVEIDAVSGRLERVDGEVNIARGFIQRSQAVLPWTSAKAKVDWRPDSIVLRGIDVQGNGISLKGDAKIAGDEDASFATRPFSATGKLQATRAEAVASLAELLAFSEPVPGNWSVDQASVTFNARGTVGDLAESAATGRFEASGLKLPTPGSKAILRVATVSGDVERGAERLKVRNIRASADGLVALGDLVVTPERAGKPGSYSTQAKVNFTHLTTLREQAPDAAFWQWVAPARPESRGEVTFRASGPTAAPERLTGTGTYRFNEFIATLPTGKGDEQWQAPIRDLRGTMTLNGLRLSLRDMVLRSDLFQGTADLALPALTTSAKPTGSVHLTSRRWQELPPLAGRVPKSVSGGTLHVDARLPEDGSKNKVSGKLALTGATYRLDLKGRQRLLPLEIATASFQLNGNRVLLPAYQVKSEHFSTTGTGTAVQAPGTPSRWLIHADGTLTTPDAGFLAATLADTKLVEGGQLTADYVVDAPSDRPADLTARAKVRLTGARPILPETALPFSNDEARINSLTGVFSVAKGATRFDDLVWMAPRFKAMANGSFAGGILDTKFQLSTSQWREIAAKLASTLPVSGGVLTASGRVRGPLATLAKSPVEGVIELHGARLASDKNASTPVEGGSVDLKANVRGTLEHIADSAATGTFTLRNIALPPMRKNAKPVMVQYAKGAFEREGTRILLRDLEASAPGARLEGSGELKGVGTGKASHTFNFRAFGPALATVIPAVAPLPGKATGGQFSGSLRIAGTASEQLASMTGQADVRNMQWTPPGQTIPLKIESLSARLSRDGESAVIDQAHLRLAGGGVANLVGKFKGLGTRAGERHSVKVDWRFEDASAWATRFLPIPGWFTGGTFTGNATIDGTTAQPAREATGNFAITDTGFMPPKQFLGGPVRPITVQSFGSPFTRSGGITKLTALSLKSSVGTAAGTVTSDDTGNAKMRVRADIERLEALVDLWPGFKDRIRGGSGSLDVVLDGPLRAPRKMAGTVLLAGRNGALTVESVDPLYAVQPFDELSLSLVRHSDGRVDIKSARMRGPKANLDGKGAVQANNRLHVEGKAWFTKDFTKKLIKPKILWPLAKLIGKSQIKSAFELDGTLQEARLDLGITDSVLWKLAIKKRVPEPLRKIATGDAPMWSVGLPPPAKVASGK